MPGLPVIKSFTPVQGEPSTTVTITGSGFTNVSSVAVNSITSEFTIDSDSQITFTLAANATSGFIEVVKSNGTAISDVPFIIAANPGDYMESTEFIASSTGLIKASKIEAGIGGIPLTFFHSVTSSGSLQDDDLGAILNCDTTEANIIITLDETLITNPVGFNCYLRNIGTGIITVTATNLQAIDNQLVEQDDFAINPFSNPSKLILGKNATVTVPQGTGIDSLAIWTKFLADPEIDYLFTGAEIANAINASPDVNNILTPGDIRDNLETLTGDDRLWNGELVDFAEQPFTPGLKIDRNLNSRLYLGVEVIVVDDPIAIDSINFVPRN